MVDRVVDPENDIPVEDVDDVLKAVIVAVLDEAADKKRAKTLSPSLVLR